MLQTSPVAHDVESDPLTSAEAARAFWQAIEHREPTSIVQTVCDEVVRLAQKRDPQVEDLRALLALDRHGQLLLEQQLLKIATAPLDSGEQERQLRHTVFELSCAFAQCYLRFLEHVRRKRLRGPWMSSLPALFVRLLYHRQIELMLHLLLYESWPRGRWRELHDVYRIAGQLCPPAAAANSDGTTPITYEDMYVRILLLQLLDTGQFLASELAVARKWIARWSNLVTLRPLAQTEKAAATRGFVVDAIALHGLRRVSTASALRADCLWLDTSPIIAAIEREIVASRDDRSRSGMRRAALLARLKTAFAPLQVLVKRRGERNALTLTSVQLTTGGLASIFAMRREEWRRQTQIRRQAADGCEDVSICAPRNDVATSALAGVTIDGLSAFPATASFGVPQPSWQVCDRSISGSRLRGRVANPRRATPGALIAFRGDAREPWTLAIVRRLKRLPGSNVEIGVEHLGANPQPIILASPQEGTQPGKQFPALYLRESAMDVNSRLRTLVVPASQFECGRALVMYSASGEVRVQLKGALEYQSDFVWTTFEVVGSPARPSLQPVSH